MVELNEQAKKVLESLTSPIVKSLHDVGITPSYLADRLKKELEATEVKVFHTKNGDIVYSKQLDALEIQQRARMDAYKLLDAYPSTRMSISGPDGTPLVTGLTEEEKSLLQAVKERLKKE